MYRVALDAIPPALADLESAASENPSLREPFAALKALIGQKIDQLRDTMRLHESNEHSAALASLADEQRSSLTRAIRDLLERMTAEERGLLTALSQDRSRTNLWLMSANLLLTILILARTIGSIVMVRRANRGREAALRSLAVTNAQLEKTVAERTAHLQEANEEVRRTVAVLNNIINSMGDAVVVTDREMNIMLMNVHHGRLDAGVLLLAKPYRKADLARMIRMALRRSDPPPRAARAEG
jgi:CHASE3 domain sensor protein